MHYRGPDAGDCLPSKLSKLAPPESLTWLVMDTGPLNLLLLSEGNNHNLEMLNTGRLSRGCKECKGRKASPMSN